MKGAQLIEILALFGLLRLMLPLHAALCMPLHEETTILTVKSFCSLRSPQDVCVQDSFPTIPPWSSLIQASDPWKWTPQKEVISYHHHYYRFIPLWPEPRLRGLRSNLINPSMVRSYLVGDKPASQTSTALPMNFMWEEFSWDINLQMWNERIWIMCRSWLQIAHSHAPHSR